MIPTFSGSDGVNNYNIMWDAKNGAKLYQRLRHHKAKTQNISEEQVSDDDLMKMFRYAGYRQPSLRILGNMIACSDSSICDIGFQSWRQIFFGNKWASSALLSDVSKLEFQPVKFVLCRTSFLVQQLSE